MNEYKTHYVVGAGIARPTHADDTVQPQTIMPADMGRAMPAPTIAKNTNYFQKKT
ncbi:MAG: hypothetical protein FWD97_07560 [Defluviitaleaceae bacterium]|nr:hypothetical protein [Defluviitaleaceae bacterium]